MACAVVDRKLDTNIIIGCVYLCIYIFMSCLFYMSHSWIRGQTRYSLLHYEYFPHKHCKVHFSQPSGIPKNWYVLALWLVHWKQSCHDDILSSLQWQLCNKPTNPTMHQSHISHNAPFCNRNVTCVHISATKWCIVGYLPDALWDLWDGSIWHYDNLQCHLWQQSWHYDDSDFSVCAWFGYVLSCCVFILWVPSGFIWSIYPYPSGLLHWPWGTGPVK